LVVIADPSASLVVSSHPVIVTMRWNVSVPVEGMSTVKLREKLLCEASCHFQCPHESRRRSRTYRHPMMILNTSPTPAS
jgi:hypothetical protein